MASPAITLIRRTIYLSIYLSIFGAHKNVPRLRFPARNGTKRERPLADAVIRDSNLFKFAFRIVAGFRPVKGRCDLLVDVRGAVT